MLTALISATTSFVIFALTQWWTHRKSQHDFLKGKMEDMLTSYVNLLALLEPLKDEGSIKSQAQDRYFKFYASMMKPDLIGELYFPDLAFNRKEAFDKATEVLMYYNAARETGLIPPHDIGSSIMIPFKDAIIRLQESAMKDHHHLTRNPTCELIRLFN